MKPHRGINTTSIAGDGLEDLPGVLIVIAFVFIFMGIFIPAHASDWLVVIFFLVEGVAAVVFIVSQRHERRATQLLQQQFHRLNENEDLRPESTGSTPGPHGKDGLPT